MGVPVGGVLLVAPRPLVLLLCVRWRARGRPWFWQALASGVLMQQMWTVRSSWLTFLSAVPPPFPVPQSIVTLSEFSKKRCDVFGKIAFECDEDLDCLGGFCKVWANSKSKWLLCFVPPHVNAL